MNRDYIEPKNTKRYEIVEIISNGELSYAIGCVYTEKKYIFFGKEIEKKKWLMKATIDIASLSVKCLHAVEFKSILEAQKELNAFNTNSVRVIKEIVKNRG